MRPNTNKKGKRPNPNVVTYQKNFTNFNDAFREFIMIPEIENVLKFAKLQKFDDDGNLIKEYYDDSDMILSDATYAIASFLSQQDNVPYLFGKKNIHTQCNISSNRCFIKTEDSIGFGWNIKYHLEEVDDETTSRRKTKQAVIDNVFCSVIIYNKEVMKDDIDTLIANGWTLKLDQEESESKSDVEEETTE